MTLTVETGSNVPNADSYMTVADAKAYWDARGFDYSQYADDEIEPALRRGTTYLDTKYAGKWLGVPANGRSQSLAWPRSGVTELFSGDDIPIDEIPRELRFALAEAASRELVNPGGLTPDSADHRILREQIGPISVQYADWGDDRPIATIIEELLGGLLSRGGGRLLNRM